MSQAPPSTDPAAAAAIAYDPATFDAVTSARSFTFENRFATRDLLAATLRLDPTHALTVLASHWPSRTMSDAEVLRIGAAIFCTNVLERVIAVAAGAAAPQELLETVADDRVQQRLLAAEVVVERRCAHPRPLGDLPGRDRPARRLVEQLGRREQQPVASGEVFAIGGCS